MTADQGTLDSSLGNAYMSKASNYGPAVFKTFELVSKARFATLMLNVIKRQAMPPYHEETLFFGCSHKSRSAFL